MPRIVGVDLPERKCLKIALTYIFGIGRTKALEICQRCDLDPEKRVSEMVESEIARINTILTESYLVEGDLRRQIQQDIRRLTSIGSYRGIRHRRSLPVRGQRTRTNARTRKGKRQTVGAIRDRATRRASKSE